MNHGVQEEPYVRTEEPEKDDDEVAPEVATTFATKGVGSSRRDKEDGLSVRDLNEEKKN